MRRCAYVTAQASHDVQRDDLTQTLNPRHFLERERVALVVLSVGEQQGGYECSFPG
jgi:hypothetical protein